VYDRFQSGRSNVAWADLDAIEFKKSRQAKFKRDDDSSEEGNPEDTHGGSDDDEKKDNRNIFAGTDSLIDQNSSHDVLVQGSLEMCRMKDANQHGPSNAVVQSVQFHPNGQLLLTAGLDKTLRLFQVYIYI
jgi:U3 small nucleolar RNA-associated protein 18